MECCWFFVSMTYGVFSVIDISNIDIDNDGVLSMSILVFDIGEVILGISVMIIGFIINHINYTWNFGTCFCMSFRIGKVCQYVSESFSGGMLTGHA